MPTLPTDPASVAREGGFDYFDLGDLALSSGDSLPAARLAYKTYGELAPGRDNVVLMPSAYSTTHRDSEWLIGPGKPLDTTRYFVICPNLFGMGLSSSPSNRPEDGPFPRISIGDNVKAQHQLLGEVFGVETLQCVVGVSMGGLQAFHWASSHPSMVLRMMSVCGSASASEHNQVFLKAIRGAIELDPAWMRGRYAENPEEGLALVARIWAGWGLSQRYYWERAYQQLGFETLEEFLIAFWEAHWKVRDANDLLAGLWTWEHADIGDVPGFNGDREAALAAIAAKAFVLPAETDLYFPVADQSWEVERMPNAELRVVPGIYGHFSCGGSFPGPDRVIEDSLRELMAWNG